MAVGLADNRADGANSPYLEIALPADLSSTAPVVEPTR
jgi:hypothetical protein